MKRVLITGEKSYISRSLEQYLNGCAGFCVSLLSVRGDQWRNVDFSCYDVCIHVAGIAHQKENNRNKDSYYQVNRDLAIEVAKKAKKDGVSQFVFFSTMSVYGVDEGIITQETCPVPKSHYGISKLQAEEKLQQMHDTCFVVVILRPPMVYGEGCPGNYQQLVRLAKIVPFFADYSNQRSMISIDRLCQFVRERIEQPIGGIFFPQDEQYRCTCKMILEIAQKNGRQIALIKAFNPVIAILRRLTKGGRKAFGTLIYRGENSCIKYF